MNRAMIAGRRPPLQWLSGCICDAAIRVSSAADSSLGLLPPGSASASASLLPGPFRASARCHRRCDSSGLASVASVFPLTPRPVPSLTTPLCPIAASPPLLVGLQGHRHNRAATAATIAVSSSAASPSARRRLPLLYESPVPRGLQEPPSHVSRSVGFAVSLCPPLPPFLRCVVVASPPSVAMADVSVPVEGNERWCHDAHRP